MNVTRRDLFKFVGGSAVGALFTPIPWKLLDDSAIWTQNWSLIPQLPRGPIQYRYSTCTLCPGACALKARCVSDTPVSLSGAPKHPISRGILCPVGFGGHHLAYHPLRLRQPMRFDGRNEDSRLLPVSFEQAVAKIASTLSSAQAGEAIAVLDQQPGRVLSDYYQAFLRALPNGLYLMPPVRECTTLARLREMLGAEEKPLGLDYENARTILSFGAPLVDGWGTPGRIIPALNERRTSGLRLIQAESWQSRTALKADRWLPIKPGTEPILALGIAHVIVAEGLFSPSVEKAAMDFADYRTMVSAFSPSAVGEITRLNPSDIIATARELARNGPAIVIAGCNPGGGPLGRSAEMAIAGLNLLLGSVGRRGGIVERRNLPGAGEPDSARHQLDDVPDHSIRLLMIDGADCGYTFPWALLERKLVPQKAIVVSFSAHASGLAAYADYIIPSAAHLESLQEALGPSDSRAANYSLSPPLLPRVEGTREPIEIIDKLAQATGLSGFRKTALDNLLKERTRALHAAKSGTLFSFSNGTAKSVAEIGSADDLWKALNDGAVWIDNDLDQKAPQQFRLFPLTDSDREKMLLEARRCVDAPLVLMPIGWRAAVASGQVSPVMSKLYQESELRGLSGQVSMNSETGLARNIADGARVIIRTHSGSREALVHHDASVMPGILLAAVGPMPNGIEAASQRTEKNLLGLCDLAENSTWRMTDAEIEKV
jgi:menaquinone reductase, molybdopterin-binding-like subunit